MKAYRVVATLDTPTSWGRIARQVPVFLLPADYLGLLNLDHAKQVAEEMLLDIAPDGTVAYVDVMEEEPT